MANHYTRQIPDLSEAQQELQRWVRRAKTAQALVLRARIVLQTEMACWTSRARERRAR